VIPFDSCPIQIEVLFGRTNSEINLLKQGFRYNHITRRRQLEDELNRGMTPTILQMFYLALSERRTDENTPVDYQLLQTDVASIASYIQSKDSGTSIAYLSSILITRNQHHLAELAKAYAKIYGIKLSETLAKTYTNWVKEAFVYIAQGAEGDGYGVDRDADMIHQAMVGMGTKDEQLIWRYIRTTWSSHFPSESSSKTILESFEPTGIAPDFNV
jgi:annexin A7/11